MEMESGGIDAPHGLHENCLGRVGWGHMSLNGGEREGEGGRHLQPTASKGPSAMTSTDPPTVACAVLVRSGQDGCKCGTVVLAATCKEVFSTVEIPRRVH